MNPQCTFELSDDLSRRCWSGSLLHKTEAGIEDNPRFISGDVSKIRTSGFIIKVARTTVETSIFPNIPSFQSHLPFINSSPLPLSLNPFNTHRIPSYPPYLACPSFSGYIHKKQDNSEGHDFGNIYPF